MSIELVIFIGLQAAGKSTFYRARLAATHELVSKDLMRHNKRKARRQEQLVAEALRASRSVVVDNTNPTVEERAPLIALGHAYGARVIGYYFESRAGASLERNKARGGRDRVPDIAIFATAKRLQRPSYAEGFDTLCCVRIADHGAFDVADWLDHAQGP